MIAPRLVVTTNGPGELMGWVRPYLRAVFAREPNADVTVVFVPCAYATGREPAVTKQLFPQTAVVDPKSYGRFLMGRATSGLRKAAGALQYLGGDLFHAATIARRLSLRPLTYKFSKRAYAQTFERFFALNEKNAAQLRAEGAPPDRVRIAGNLVADAVVGSLGHFLPPPGEGDGVCFMPGSRPAQFEWLLPFFAAAARELVCARPGLQATFVLSPFTSDDHLRAALAKPDVAYGHLPGSVSADGAAIEVDGARLAIDRSGNYQTLSRARLVVTIPGTNTVEAAVLGRPMLVVVPLNRPERIVVNGPAGYLHHVPIIGKPLKSWLVRRIGKRFPLVAQPNIDSGRMLVPEIRGVLTPADVVAHAGALLDRPAELRATAESLAELYAADVGAADRMAEETLSIAWAAAAPAPAG